MKPHAWGPAAGYKKKIDLTVGRQGLGRGSASGHERYRNSRALSETIDVDYGAVASIEDRARH